MHERVGASYESIHATLAHILAAEIIWLSRWREVSPPTLLGADDFANLRAIGARWAAPQRQELPEARGARSYSPANF
jgi:uncharacterized damage-inducible protein DinB